MDTTDSENRQYYPRPHVQFQQVNPSPQRPMAAYPPQPQPQLQYRPQVMPSPTIPYQPMYRPPQHPQPRPVHYNDEHEVVTGRFQTPQRDSPDPVVSGRYVPPPPQYHPRPPQSFAQPLAVNRPAELPMQPQQRPQPPTSIDIRPQQYTPIGVHSLITPTRVTPSPSQQVTFRLPAEEFVERNNDFNKKFDTRMRATTPTTESFRRFAAPPTPEFEISRRATFNRSKSADRRYQGDNDSGVDESTQEKQERNGGASPGSPLKSPSKIPTARAPSTTPRNNRSRSTSKVRLSVKTPDSPVEPLIKKVPMNKIQVGAAPSPNLKQVKSRIGSLDNATHKPGGGNVKIENRKIEIKAAPRIEAKNEKYAPKGGEKKIISTKLQWNAKSKIGSLENANHKPGGGDKKIEEVKVDFKGKAKPKIGSLDNTTHQPGGGDVKIVHQKIEIKAQSKIGSMDNVKHRPGGGDKKIFDDKEYLKNVDHPIQPTPPAQSPTPASLTTSITADENLNQQV